jgi:predicted amidohydrolase
MTCPQGHTMTEPAATAAGIQVCAECGQSFLVDDAGVSRPATAADTTALSDVDLQTLRTARGRVARANRRQR